MLTSKQRAYLRGIASTYETIYQIGKGGVTEAMCKDIAEALRKFFRVRHERAPPVVQLHVLLRPAHDVGHDAPLAVSAVLQRRQDAVE